MKKAICRLSFAVGVLLLSLAMKPPAPSKAAASPPNGAVPKPTVELKDFSFQPNTITVPAGALVTWTNMDEEPHTVVSTEKLFASHALDTNDQFTYTFDKPGKYEYFCSIHPKMTGTIIVKTGE